jgi:hypothetical protein
MDLDDKWVADESDDEYDDEYITNEIPPQDINNEFRNNVLNIKHIIYDSTVLAPKVGTPDAQNNKLIQQYLKNINQVYIICLKAQKGLVDANDLINIPEKAREPIKKVINWLTDFFKKNRAPDTIPYEDYINKSFHEYQFNQDNSFE